MKKRLIIFSLLLVTVSLAAYTVLNRDASTHAETANLNDDSIKDTVTVKDKEPLDFFFFLGSRFESIKKSEVDKATSIYDFISEEDRQDIKTLNATELILVINDKRTHFREYGTGENLNNDQIDLLHSLEYSKHFVAKAIYENNNSEYHDINPHYTVVPEIQATYADGLDALMTYLKDNKSKDTRFIDEKKMQAVKVSFTITAYGTMTNVNLDRTTGYPQLDLELKELIKNAPGNWNPAQNAEGEQVEQELVLSFGLANSC